MDALMPSSANFKCAPMGFFDETERAYDFDLGFALEGNFTITWLLALDNFDTHVLCGEHFFITQELVRRTRFGAIPVPIDSTRFLTFDDDPNIKADPQLSYIKDKAVDIGLDTYPLYPQLLSFVSLSHTSIEPSMAILSGLYPNTKSNSFFSIVNVFFPNMWLLILVTIISTSLILSCESLILDVNHKYHTITKFIVKYGSYLWTVWNALFMQTFKYTRLHRPQHLILIGLLLVNKVLILSLFSSQILSITIENPYQYIDNIEDLEHKGEHLQPILFVAESLIDGFKTDNKLGPIVNRALPEYKFDYDFEKLFTENIVDIIKNISFRLTHVLLASYWDVQLIIEPQRALFESMTHVSRTHYWDKVQGFVIPRHTDPLLAKTFHQIVMSSDEAGLRTKWVKTGVQQAYDLFGDKTFTFDVKTVEDYMVLDEMKIAFGPYLTGVILAFVVLLVENSDTIDVKEHDLVRPEMFRIDIDIHLPLYIPPNRSLV